MDTNILEILMNKEIILAELVAWLKAKGLWQEAKQSLSIKVTEDSK